MIYLMLSHDEDFTEYETISIDESYTRRDIIDIAKKEMKDKGYKFTMLDVDGHTEDLFQCPTNIGMCNIENVTINIYIY